MDDKALLSKDKIAVDIAKLERNLNQVSESALKEKKRKSMTEQSIIGMIQSIILKKKTHELLLVALNIAMDYSMH